MFVFSLHDCLSLKAQAKLEASGVLMECFGALGLRAGFVPSMKNCQSCAAGFQPESKVPEVLTK